jgi:GDPmannose 4,6-dehydratase
VKAVVVGSAGQDGSLLFDRLAGEGWQVVGLERNGVRTAGLAAPPVERVTLGIREETEELLRAFRADRVFYLAAYHHSSEEDRGEDLSLVFRRMTEVHVTALVDFLECIRQDAHGSHLVYAASSHVFGAPPVTPQSEATPMNPSSVYGITKAAGIHMCRSYRSRGVRASAVILYNHESPRRRGPFVSQRIVQGARRARDAAALGQRVPLHLGRLDAVVDWGFAPDYVDAMVRVSAQPEADDYVVATGVPHTVRDFARVAFAAVGLDWQNYVEEDRSLLRSELPALIGDSSKLRRSLGWRPSVTFDEMVEALVVG